MLPGVWPGVHTGNDIATAGEVIRVEPVVVPGHFALFPLPMPIYTADSV